MHECVWWTLFVFIVTRTLRMRFHVDYSSLLYYNIIYIPYNASLFC